MKQRTKTAAVILLITITLLIFSEYIVYPIALALLSAVSIYEIFNVIGVKKNYFLVIPAYLFSLTLFPDSVEDVLADSILGRAQERGIIQIGAHQIRDYTASKQCQVDDYPYGGGRGAVMTADPLYRCWEAICDQAGGPVHTIYMSPCGHTFKQADAIRLSKMENIILVCGHYEGIDQRFIDECVDEEISLGDFVLTGGEIAAMAVTDAVCRMVPGVLADPECFEDESHYNGLLEYPQYTRPAVWHGREIPEILTSGNHEKVRQWRRKQALRRTKARRPDMYEKLDLSSKQDKKLLKEMEQEDAENGSET